MFVSLDAYISPDILSNNFLGGQNVDTDKEEHLTYVDNQTLHTQDVISLYEKTLFDIVTPSGHNLLQKKLLNLCYLVNHFYYGCIIT